MATRQQRLDAFVRESEKFRAKAADPAAAERHQARAAEASDRAAARQTRATEKTERKACDAEAAMQVNGTDGTDHGTGTVALLVGGAIKGGHVIVDWPGLRTANLYEGRDLKPTTDLRAVLKGLLKDHLRADERALAANVFPGSATVKPTAGLVG